MPFQPDPQTRLMQALEDVVVPATTGPFVVKDHFKKGASLQFSTIWGEFRSRFFGKIENPMPEVRMRKYKLLRLAPDGPIIAELGGESSVASSLSIAFAIMRCQANGEAGILQTNGFANIFYVRDIPGELCAIRIGWASDGWVVDAIPVQDPLAWNGKHEIFCPAPLPKA